MFQRTQRRARRNDCRVSPATLPVVDAPGGISRIARAVACVAVPAVLSASCSGGAARQQAATCAAAWSEGVATARAQIDALVKAEGTLEQRTKDAQKASTAVEKRLARLTIRREDAAFAYPDKIKARVAAGRMRLTSIETGREELGKPLAAVSFDVELQGAYGNVSRAIAALYDQPKAFFLDRVEVNILDERRKLSHVKASFHVYRLTEGAPKPGDDPGTPKGWNDALAWSAPAECKPESAPPELEAAKAELRAKEPLAKAVRAVEVLEESVKSRGGAADDLLARRDDDRASWTAYSDELVKKAKGSVTGLAELRFDAKGEPDWKL